MPIIIITGCRDVKHAIETIPLDVDDYLLKPFRAEVLLKRISSSFQ
jgi:DNA-binding response OmpR family regulator